MADDLKLSKRQLYDACDAWGRTPDTGGGCLGLGLWLSKHKPHFSVNDYADLVAMVRAELNDTTDDTHPARRVGEELKGEYYGQGN